MSATNTNPTAAEALGAKIPFNYKDVDFLVLPSSEWSYEALEAYEEGRIVTFLKDVLGKEQHDRFKATKPKAGDVNEFVKAMQKALGIQGN
jgi:hypothetical protein